MREKKRGNVEKRLEEQEKRRKQVKARGRVLRGSERKMQKERNIYREEEKKGE